MKSGNDPLQIRIRKLATHTVDESAHVPRVVEQRLLATITALAIVFLFGEKPQADGGRRAEKSLSGSAIMQSSIDLEAPEAQITLASFGSEIRVGTIGPCPTA